MYAFFNPRRKSLVRGNALVLGSVLAALILSSAPVLRQNLWMAIPALFVLVGAADTLRNMGKRWNLYNAGVLLSLYMDLLSIVLIYFLMLYPFLNLGVRNS